MIGRLNSEDVTLEDLGSVWEERLSFGFERPGKLHQHVELLHTIVDCLQRVDDLVCIIREVPHIADFQLRRAWHRPAPGPLHRTPLGILGLIAWFRTLEECVDRRISLLKGHLVDGHVHLLLLVISCSGSESISDVLLVLEFHGDLLIGRRVHP